jgi:hypothetical protein
MCVCGNFKFLFLAAYYNAIVVTLPANNVAWPVVCTLTYPTGGHTTFILDSLPSTPRSRVVLEKLIVHVTVFYYGSAEMQLYGLHRRQQY